MIQATQGDKEAVSGLFRMHIYKTSVLVETS